MRILVMLLLAPVSIYCQYSHRSYPEMYYGRQTTARADAMGKAYVALEGDLGAVFANPAGIAAIRGFHIIGSYVPPPYQLTQGYYTFFGAGLNLKKYVSIAVSNLRFDWGKTPVFSTRSPYQQRSTVTISVQAFRNLAFGLNTNYFVDQPGYGDVSGKLYFDFGCLQKISIGNSVLRAGVSLSNFTSATLKVKLPNATNKLPLPVIAKYGLSYTTTIGKSKWLDSVPILQLLTQVELQDLLDSRYETTVKLGGELKVMGILNLRVGYFTLNRDNFGYPDRNRSSVNKITYGTGIEVPLYKVTKLPLQLTVDYTALPEEVYIYDPFHHNNFKSFTLGIRSGL